MKSRYLFRVLLLVGILIVLTLVALMVVMVYRHQKSTRLFTQGKAAYASGDYAAAEPLFTRYLAADPNKEEAWLCLGEISEKRGDLLQAALCWGRLMRLNPLNDEYVNRCIKANYRLHNYNELGRIFLRLSNARRDEFRDIYVLTKYKVDPKSVETNKLIKGLPADGVFARLIRALETPGPAAELAFLETTSDPVVQVEAYMQDAAIAEWQKKDLQHAEECFRKAAQINPTLCLGELGSFLLRQSRYADAVAVFRQIPEKYLPLNVIPNYAEALFHEKDEAMLRRLAALIPRSASQGIFVRAYVHSIIAFLKKQPDEMAKNFNVAKMHRDTPVGLMLRYAVALHTHDIPMLCSVLAIWKRTTIFQQKLPDLLAVARPLLAQSIREKNWQHATALGHLFLNVKPPELLAWKAYLLGYSATRGVIPETVLRDAIRLFPKDPLFRTMMLRSVIIQQDFAGALTAFDRLIETSPDSQTARYSKALFLEQNGRVEEAFGELKKLLAQEHSLQNLKHCLAFGIRTGNREALQIAAKDPSLQSIAAFEQERRYGDINRAEAILNSTALEQGLSAQRAEDRELMLPLAICLALVREHPRAIALYEALAPYVTHNATIDVNLSEIYSDLGDKKHALEYGEKAYKRFPKSELAQSIYGARCAENGDFEKAAEMIPDSVTSQPFRGILINSLEHLLESHFANQHYAICQRIITRLQKLQPDNAAAKEFQAKIHQLHVDKADKK